MQKHILVIPLRYIGDTILSVPLIRTLNQTFPSAKIDVLVSKTTQTLLEPSPYIHQVVVEPKSFFKRLALLQAGHYDTVLILRKSVTMALLCQLAGIPLCVGYDKQRFAVLGYRRWGWFLHRQVTYPSLKTTTPQAMSHLGFMRAVTPADKANLLAESSDLELWYTQDDRKRLEQLLALKKIDQNRPIAIFHASSASHGKQIELVKFLQALQHLSEKGYQLISTGTSLDVDLYDSFAQQHGLELINLAGQTTLRETYCLYTMAALLLTVDSSPVHLGSAASIPSIVAVFGPTNQLQWGAFNPKTQFIPVFIDLPCRPCYAKICEHNNCRVQITAVQIYNAVLQALAL